MPVVVPLRHPHRLFSSPFILILGFVFLILVGGLLLSLPVANHQGVVTSPDVSFFTATSAVTVTGLTVVNTGTYWNLFGQAVIFSLMLIGGLGFITVATFALVLIGQRSTLPERMVMRDTMGADRMEGLRRIARNVVVLVLLIYLAGAALILWNLQGVADMGLSESVWQSIFLSVSAFNNAGFSILPEIPSGTGLAWLGGEPALLAIMMVLIILGGIGYTVLVDIYRHRRFARLSLDTRLIIVTSLFLWAFGAVALFLAEFSNPSTHLNLGLGESILSSVFHSVSGRTAGFAVINFGLADDFTKLVYPGLMFIGGAAGSVAGGIKVNTFAVIVAAVISSIRGRAQAEAFGREIAHFQVMRALTVAAMGFGLLMLSLPTLTLTEPEVPFLNLLFDTVSAFGTTGLSTGIVPELSLAGKGIFMATMLIGRLGPLTMALALAPQEQTVYRFVQERVKIG